MAEVAGQGIGARVRRKEDLRFLRGRGNYVSDMVLPGQSEVAFLRSPIAHGRIRRIAKPPDSEGRVFVRSDLNDVAAIVAPTTVPGYKLSEWHPLAHDKVRFVGEAIAMCVAPTRAEAEDLTEEIEVEFDELPVLVNALAARVAENIRVHEQWSDNSFLTSRLRPRQSRSSQRAKGAPVVVKRELSLEPAGHGADGGQERSWPTGTSVATSSLFTIPRRCHMSFVWALRSFLASTRGWCG